MLNKNGWFLEDWKNFILFVNFYFENIFIKFLNLKYVYVYLIVIDYVVYGFFFRIVGLLVIFFLYFVRWKFFIFMWIKKRGCYVM